MRHNITTPLTSDKVKKLKCGDTVYISGTIYTARDAAHKRMIEALESGAKLPFEIENSILYYVGPTPAKPDQVIGSAGPTTSYRMDAYAPKLIELGLKGMVGKGDRANQVVDAIVKNSAVYFGAIGGAGALLSMAITQSKVIAYDDLGAEAIHELCLENFPVTVIIDCNGNNLYKTGKQNYLDFRSKL